MKPRPYQEEAITFAYEHDRCLILAKMGAGKTLIALRVMDELQRDGVVNRWLVIAPKRVANLTWPAEKSLWSPQFDLGTAIGTPIERRSAFTHRNVVTNYDNLQWLCDGNKDLLDGFDGVVFDELTRCKSSSGKRYKSLLSVIDKFNVRIGLTGSFTSNGLEDVFAQVKIIDQSLLGRSKGAFLQQYFWCADPQFGDWIPRPKALEQIMARIKPATFMLENREYADTLPPLHYVEMQTSMDMTRYNKFKREMVMELEGATLTAVNMGVVQQKLTQLSSGFILDTQVTPSNIPGKFITISTPHWFSTHKFDMLDEILEENHRAPTLIWYWYQEELAELQRRYPKAETLDSPNAIDRWNNGEIEVLLAQPAGAGHGLNLQGQCNMIFLSLPWSLELFEQAVARLHRSGQRHEVYCYILLTKGTVDEKIWGALRDKRSLAEIAIEALK